jgi:hypothetical protein
VRQKAEDEEILGCIGNNLINILGYDWKES